MPDIIVTMNGSPVGRLSLTQEAMDAIADALAGGGRFELSAGFENRPEGKPTLVEWCLSPLPTQSEARQ